MSDTEIVNKLANEIAAEPSTADSSWVPTEAERAYFRENYAKPLMEAYVKTFAQEIDREMLEYVKRFMLE
jgi:hypothetical protein